MKPTYILLLASALGRELGKGGEGAVYDINEFVDSVAKIYQHAATRLKTGQTCLYGCDSCTAIVELCRLAAGNASRWTRRKSYRFYDAKSFW